MEIPRYWAKGTTSSNIQMRNPATGENLDVFACWGWSNISKADAEANGRLRANAIAEMIESGERPDHYLYGDRPMREEIIDEWKNIDGTTYAAITLNAYGCRVLNTASVMFVDIDLPEVHEPMGSLTEVIMGLFGKKKPKQPSLREQYESDALSLVQDMIKSDSRCGIRVYRTFAGLRYIMTHGHADPSAESTLSAMDVLKADPLYVQLCSIQDCFRARLTPKPWRCNGSALGYKYPWKDTQTEQKVLTWLKDYEQKSQGYATCTLLEHYGFATMDDEISQVVEYHDKATKAESGEPLA